MVQLNTQTHVHTYWNEASLPELMSHTVNPVIFAKILTSQMALKHIFATFKIRS